jgi:predicted outer membrane protein
MRRCAGAAVALLLLGAAAIATSAPAEEAGRSETFIERSLTAGRIQASLARLASIRADRPAVKQFAAAVRRELEIRNARLARLAGLEGVAPEAFDLVPEYSTHEIPQRTREFHRLRVRSGAAFDKQFLNAVIVSHENAIRGYEAEATGAHREIKALAADELPKLRTRLGEARRLLEQVSEERP